MREIRFRPWLLVGMSLVGLLLVLALVWVMIFEELRTRRLSLEYELYRASATLAESWLGNPDGVFVGGPVVGFGVYERDGTAVVAQGSAPTRLDMTLRMSGNGLPEPGPDGKTLRLLRPLPGRQPPDPAPRGLGQIPDSSGGMMGGGMMGGGFRQRFGQGGMNPLDPAFAGQRTMWIEYSYSASSLGEWLLATGGAILSIVLISIYVLVLVLAKRNAELKDREVRTRELAELGQAARTLVHEIKNPLGVIGIQAATLRRREGEDSPAGKAAAVIDGEVRRLARMADRIREFLKAGPGQPREVDLRAFLEDFRARHDPENSGVLALVLPAADSTIATVLVDPDRLALALDNLVANAKEADPGSTPSIELARKGRGWTIAVADRGPGVPVESRPRLFEPFFTTKEKGSGIGLALAKGVASGANGELTYSPRQGGGSLFILSLPSSG